MSSIVTDRNITAELVGALREQIAKQVSFHELRVEATVHLEKLGLPTTKAEEYKYTPLTRSLEKNFNITMPNAPAADTDIAPALIPGVDAHVFVFINGAYSPSHSKIGTETGITIQRISDAAQSNEELLRQHVGRIADHSVDGFAAWNTVAFTDGVFLQVGDNKRLEKPVLIYHIHDTNSGQVISATRNLVLIGRNAEATVLEKFYTAGKSNGFSSVVTEGIIGENSGLAWYSIQNDSGNRYHFELKQFKQASSSRVNTYTFTLDGKVVRNNLHLELDGQGIDSHMYGLYLLGKDTLADNHTVVDHRQPNSFSNEMYKGIIDDSAKGVFNGKIYVRPNAQKTNAFQANRNILLSDKATINTKPQLEIWADDVKCSHGCTSGQLDEEALFYLRTRGIHKDTAQAMMLYAFAAELLETMKQETIMKYIDSLLSERLHKNF